MELVSAQGDVGTSMVRSATGRAIWLALIVGAGTALSLSFACATPFAALATLAALKTDRRDTAAALGLVWLTNQVIGYAFLGYPATWDSIAWGGAIALAAGSALLAAIALTPRRHRSMAISLPFMGAFATYELVLYIAAFLLPSEPGAYSMAVVWALLVRNALTLGALLIVYQVALFAGLLVRKGAPGGVAAAH